jgi:hypothetical protein
MNWGSNGVSGRVGNVRARWSSRARMATGKREPSAAVEDRAGRGREGRVRATW